MSFDSQYMVGANAISASVELIRAQHEESTRRLLAYKSEQEAEAVARERGERSKFRFLYSVRHYIYRVAPRLASRLTL